MHVTAVILHPRGQTSRTHTLKFLLRVFLELQGSCKLMWNAALDYLANVESNLFRSQDLSLFAAKHN